MNRWTVNPVLTRELTERWRGRRAVATLTGYLTVLSLLAYLLYRIGRSVLLNQAGFGPDLAGGGPLLGRFLVEGMLFFGLVGILFVAPGYAATQIAGERERRTLGLLQLTLLTPWHIVYGKLAASIAWLLLLVVATLPVGAVAFFLGGVAPSDLLAGLGFLLLVAICIAAIGLGISAVTKRTTAAVILTYGVVLLIVVGTLFASLAEFIVRDTQRVNPQTPVALYANPFFGLSDAVDAVSADLPGRAQLPSPLSLFAAAHPSRFEERPNQGAVAVDRAEPAPGAGVEVVEPPELPEPEQRSGGPWLPVWAITGGLHVLLGVGGLFVATRRVGRIEGKRSRQAPEPAAVEPEPEPA